MDPSMYSSQSTIRQSSASRHADLGPGKEFRPPHIPVVYACEAISHDFAAYAQYSHEENVRCEFKERESREVAITAEGCHIVQKLRTHARPLLNESIGSIKDKVKHAIACI
jgi:hypothetical protein